MMTNKQKMIKLDKKLMDFIITLNKKQFDDFFDKYEIEPINLFIDKKYAKEDKKENNYC
uniref:Uncharacterized protein n=2 Tax=Spiroplasma kunkelii TaxID=47834 RepID=Q5VCC7_SPIKU|nr:hypothetical protein SKUN_p0050 [Spiroplasma kunkelii CR2-3x]